MGEGGGFPKHPHMDRGGVFNPGAHRHYDGHPPVPRYPRRVPKTPLDGQGTHQPNRREARRGTGSAPSADSTRGTTLGSGPLGRSDRSHEPVRATAAGGTTGPAARLPLHARRKMVSYPSHGGHFPSGGSSPPTPPNGASRAPSQSRSTHAPGGGGPHARTMGSSSHTHTGHGAPKSQNGFGPSWGPAGGNPSGNLSPAFSPFFFGPPRAHPFPFSATILLPSAILLASRAVGPWSR